MIRNSSFRQYILTYNQRLFFVLLFFQASICATFKKDPKQDGASMDQPDLDITFVNTVHDKVCKHIIVKFYEYLFSLQSIKAYLHKIYLMTPNSAIIMLV